MKYYNILLCFIISISLPNFSQNKLELSTFSGFENNINKTPNRLIIDDEIIEKTEFQLNSFYQDFKVNYKYIKEWQKNSFALYLTPEIRYYFSEPEANTIIYYTRLAYKYNIKKYVKWENNIRYKVKDRSGQDLDENELSLPFGYQLWNIDSGIRFRMSKNNRSIIKLNYGDKKFDNTNSRNVSYQYYGFSGELKQIRWKNHLLHSYGVSFEYTKRNYTITDFEEESIGKRDWSYLNCSIFYKLPISKKWIIQPEIEYQKRTDNSNNSFGYIQITTELNLRYESARLSAKLSANYSSRKFENLSAKNSEEINVGKLRYNYLRTRFSAEYYLTNKLLLITEGYLINRQSNNSNINTNAFRSYNNNYIGLGLKYKF